MGLGRSLGIFMSSQRCGTFCSFIICLSLMIAATGMSEVYRVDSTAPDGGDGLSWERAFNSIQDAVDAAYEDDGGDVWVAKGTYTSEEGYYTTIMKEGVDLFGGFAGSEISYDQRDWKNNPTIISGNKKQCTVLGANNATFDGFSVTHSEPSGHVGFYNYETSPVISNCQFMNNRCNNPGAAISNSHANPTISNCTFSSNYTRFWGGAISNDSSNSIITNCTFTDNWSRVGGGAIHNTSSSPIITNCLIVGNSTDKYGGGIFNRRDSSPSIINCTFTKNWARLDGGAAYSFVEPEDEYQPTPVFNSCIMWDNGTELIHDNVTPLISYCCIQGDATGEGNIYSDPLLAPVSYRPLPSSPCIDSGDSSLTSTEPDLLGNTRVQNNRVDMGALEYIPGSVTSMLGVFFGPDEVIPLGPEGRIANGPWFNNGETVEVYQGNHSITYKPLPNWEVPQTSSVEVSNNAVTLSQDYTYLSGNHIKYVSGYATGNQKGSSWSNAFRKIQSAIDSVSSDDYTEIWVAEGVYFEYGEVTATMKENVHLYGGFAGDESTRSERNYFMNKTTIDGTISEDCVYGAHNATLDGFTIDKGGMYNSYCFPVIKNCIFTNCNNGMKNWNASPTIINCIFHHNRSAIGMDESSATITNCTSANNYYPDGDGILGSNSYPTVTNCIFSGSEFTSKTPVPIYSTLTYNCIPGGYEGEGNIDADPLLDPISLRPKPSSPCIDTGGTTQITIAEFDILNNERIQNGHIDMGAQEHIPNSSTVELTIILGPDDILPLHPQWRLNGSDWYSSGTTFEIYPGTYQIEYSHLGNWTEPVENFITVDEETTSRTFNYLFSAEEEICYVNKEATGTNTGESWENAFTSIHSAINAVNQYNYEEIWVASGVYTGRTLQLQENTYLYGGFDGTETERTQRDWSLNPTIIDGENTHPCLTGANNSCLDGFTVQNGNATNSSTSPQSYSGAGIENTASSPTIANCIFKNNTADNGGAIFNIGSSPIIRNCIFVNNVSLHTGGCIHNMSTSSPIIENCLFEQNTAKFGGAIANRFNCSPRIINCLIRDNKASHGGGIYNFTNSLPSIINTSIINNSAVHGGAIDQQSDSPSTIINSIIWNNSTGISGDQSLVTYSCVQGGPNDSNNINTDPKLDPVTDCILPNSPCIDTGIISQVTESDHDLLGNERVQNNQIDMGCFEYVPNTESGSITVNLEPTEILSLNPQWRLTDSNWQKSGDRLDLYPQEITIEFTPVANFTTPAPVTFTPDSSDQSLTFSYSSSPGNNLLYVDIDATGSGDGQSWENAFTEIQSAINTVPENQPVEIWVAEGLYAGVSEQFTVTLQEYISLYGGFNSTETSRSERDWKRSKTIIKNLNHCCISGANNSLIDGFTITNKNGYGGGITNNQTSPRISNCIFMDTTAVSGAAMMNIDCSPQVSNCIFWENEAHEQGGAIYNKNSLLTLTNATIAYNTAQFGGGIYNDYSTVSGKNNIIYANSTGIEGEESIGREGEYNNLLLSYSCLQEEISGEGNIFTDPFLDLVSNQLLPNSPCIDTGNVNDIEIPPADIFANQRVQNNQIDMGACEYIPNTTSAQVTINLNPAEILSLNPKWKLDNGPWFENGETIETYTGTFPIDFSPIQGWEKPGTSILTIPQGGISKSYNYVPSQGNHYWYVDKDATGNNNGTSWENAFNDIQSAINTASFEEMGEIWVAEGTYTGAAEYVITLREGIKLYGGFTGLETEREQRNWESNQTVIDGEGIRSCIYGSNDAILDGFFIANGFSKPANLYLSENSSASGITNKFVSPTIKNCEFINNRGEGSGYPGTIFNYYSFSPINYCLFNTTEATSTTTAICNISSSPLIENSHFQNIRIGISGSDYLISNINNSSPVIRSCDFISTASEGPLTFIANSLSSPTITSCHFKGTEGGYLRGITNNKSSPTISHCHFDDLPYGIYNYSESYPVITNTVLNCDCAILSRNLAGSYIRNCTLNSETNLYIAGYSGSEVTNSILWCHTDNIDHHISGGGRLWISNSCVRGGYEGTGNIDSDPLFVDAEGGDFRLLPDSPCIDSGTAEGAPSTDIRGVSRPQDNGYDMGAYEFYRVFDQLAEPSLFIADLSLATEENGWFFHRPDMYRDIEGYHDAQYSTWDMTLTDNEMSFGYVESPLIAVVENESQPMANDSIVGETGPEYLYRATYFVASDLDEASQAPVIRLRVSSESFQRSDLVVVSSEELGELSPGINGRFYTTYFQIPENESNFRLDLDVLSFDPRDSKQATISLHYAEVEYLGSVNHLDNEITVMSTSFITDDLSVWNSYPTEELSIPAPETFSSTNEGLLIRGTEPTRMEPEQTIAMFGYWSGQIDNHPLEKSLYRIRWIVGSDIQQGSEAQLPTFRLRFNDETMKVSSLVNIDSVVENTNLPSTGNPKIYDSWFEIPAEIAGNNWELSFDYLFVDKPAPESDDPTAALLLKAIEVYHYDIP